MNEGNIWVIGSLDGEALIQRHVKVAVLDLLDELEKLRFFGPGNLVQVTLQFNFSFFNERRILVTEDLLAGELKPTKFLVKNLQHRIAGLELILVEHGSSENFVLLYQNNVVLDVLPNRKGLKLKTVVGSDSVWLFIRGFEVSSVDG